MIVLVGFMGAGKTTIGHLLAEKLGLPFLDSDLVIEQRTGRSIREIFDADGESAFRRLEHDTIAALLGGSEMVLALGGGAAEHPGTRALLADHHVLYLEVGYDEALLRVAHDQYRPLLHRPDLGGLYQRRLAVYRGVATLIVATDGRRPETIAHAAIEQLVRVRDLPAGTRTTLVSCTGGTYNVHVGQGLLAQVARLVPVPPQAENIVLLVGTGEQDAADIVEQAWHAAAQQVHRVALPSRQVDKTMASVSQAAGSLAELAVHKADLLVGVGGEVSCDVAGFLAATYNRGMALALLPTTLAAQADTAVGGKASLNLPQGPNLLGTVHQPVAVLADVQLAAARRAHEYDGGLAEIAKHALITGGRLLELVHRQAADLRSGGIDALRAAVSGSVEVKAAIVSNDEREQGERLVLNYGHTFGHAIEQLQMPGPAGPDTAVALGMMAAAYLARRQGRIGADLVAEHADLLAKLGLPTAGRLPLEELREAFRRDKKYRGGTRFVVLNGVGHPEAGVRATDAELEGVVQDLQPR